MSTDLTEYKISYCKEDSMWLVNAVLTEKFSIKSKDETLLIHTVYADKWKDDNGMEFIDGHLIVHSKKEFKHSDVKTVSQHGYYRYRFTVNRTMHKWILISIKKIQGQSIEYQQFYPDTVQFESSDGSLMLQSDGLGKVKIIEQ